MIRINLLPLKESEQALKRRQQLSIGALALCFLVLLMVIPYLWQKRTLAHLDSEAAELTAEIAKLDEQAKEAKDLEKKVKELEGKVKVIKDLDQKRVGPARVLADLSASVPDKLWVEDFTETNDSATITGWALDNQTVADFMRQVEASPYFNKVDLAEATQPDQPSEQLKHLAGIGNVRLKRFVIKASLDYFGRGSSEPQPTAEAKHNAENQRADT